MHSSTLFLLFAVFLVALTISSAYPGEEKEEKKEGEAKEGEKGGEEKKEGEDKKEEEKKGKEDEKSGAISLFSSNCLFTVLSLALGSLILSIH